jgi:hypothetical protein
MDKIRQSYCNDNNDNEKNTIDEILRKSIIPLTKVSIASNVNTIRMEQLLKTMKNGNSKVDPLLLNFSLDRSHSHHYPIVEIKKK